MVCKFHKTYTANKREFNLNIDTSFKTNAFNVLFGASGVGKTSLLRAISGLEKIDKGTIHFKESLWVDTSEKVDVPSNKRNIAFVFQDYALFPNMSVLKNLEFANNNIDSNLYKKVTSFLELEKLLELHPYQLSGGQKQRVALARAILQQPQLLLLDEPLTALDETLRTKLQNFLIKIQQQLNLTIIMVSHNLQEVLRVADYVCVMENGKIVQHGNPTILLSDNPNNTIKGIILEINEKSASVLIGNQQIIVLKKQILNSHFEKGETVKIDFHL